MFSRERVTWLIELCSDPKIELKPKFVFNVKGTRTHLTLPKGVHYQWAPKGSYRIDQILGVVDKLLNRFNMFTENSFAIYVLDNYSAHLMPQVPQVLFKKVYVLIVIGGGITGNIQINDRNCHRVLKKHYQDLEMKFMLEQLVKGPIKIPSPSQNKMMYMLLQVWRTLEIDTKREFKSPFVTNSLDGSEDYLVSHKLFALIGDEMADFQKESISQILLKLLKKLLVT